MQWFAIIRFGTFLTTLNVGAASRREGLAPPAPCPLPLCFSGEVPQDSRSPDSLQYNIK
jgi:hypothetical protein